MTMADSDKPWKLSQLFCGACCSCWTCQMSSGMCPVFFHIVPMVRPIVMLLFALWQLTLRWYGQWSKGIDACMPLIPNSFQIWAVLPEVVWSLPQDCWPLVFHCLVCVASLWPQQPVGSRFALCHVCCTKSNGSFYCMEVSTIYHFNNAMINGRYCANVWEESLENMYFTWQ